METGKKNTKELKPRQNKDGSVTWEVPEYYDSQPIRLKVKPDFKSIVSENLPMEGHRITIKAMMDWKEILKVWEEALTNPGDFEIEFQMVIPYQYVLALMDKRLDPRTE